MGFRLEDFYDEERGKGSFREKYQQCVDNPELSRIEIPAIELHSRVMRSQLEAATPFTFFRDEVNRMNPNKHEGMIYSSNLCTEIAQNMSATNQQEEYINEDGDVIIVRKPGDFVVCNLFSLNLPEIHKHDVLKEATRIGIWVLDETIELNKLPVKQAEVTNKRYRALGLGALGWDHLRVLKGIEWESEEAVELTDKIFEEIAYEGIKASAKKAKERGAYPLFKGSDWHTGDYFRKRGYLDGKNKEKWTELMHFVQENGLRNAYLFAIAPNSTTSHIMGTTASIDPSFKREYVAERGPYRINTVAPDITGENYSLYADAANAVDQFWSIKQNIARQRHIDQAISFNLYVPNTIPAKVLLQLFTDAWEGGMKTMYYTTSTGVQTTCEWCHA